MNSRFTGPEGQEAVSALAKLAYRIDEATIASGLGRTSIYQAIRRGALKSTYVAGRRLILRDDLEAFLRSGRDAA